MVITMLMVIHAQGSSHRGLFEISILTLALLPGRSSGLSAAVRKNGIGA
jgi:hypothetical protein